LGALGAVILVLVVIITRDERLFPEPSNAEPPHTLVVESEGNEETHNCVDGVEFHTGRELVTVEAEGSTYAERPEAYVRLRAAVPVDPLPAECTVTRNARPLLPVTNGVTLTVGKSEEYALELPPFDNDHVTFAVDVTFAAPAPTVATRYEWELLVGWQDEEKRLQFKTLVPAPR
jgi:hypothetical protein